MKTEDFNIKFKEGILKGTHKLSWNGLPTRIICWDRKGMNAPNGAPLPIIALADCGTQEKLLQVANDGTIYDCGINRDFKLQVTYDAIGYTKKARVVFSLLNCPYIEKYMQKYNYQENEEMGWYWNAITFANAYAGMYLNELHADLKADGHWEYDDDYDW